MQYAIAAKADQRGNIERFFERNHVDLIGALPGKTFSGAKDRGDYDSKSFREFLTVDELIYIIVRYIVDNYHNLPMKDWMVKPRPAMGQKRQSLRN